jgi:hypothetical protein
VGIVDGKHFRLRWWDHTWVFLVADQKEHLYTDQDRCLWSKYSPYPSHRPRSSHETVDEMRNIIHSSVQEWRSVAAQK